MCESVGNDKQTIKHFYFFSRFLPAGIPVHAILFAYMGEFWGQTVSACGEK